MRTDDNILPSSQYDKLVMLRYIESMNMSNVIVSISIFAIYRRAQYLLVRPIFIFLDNNANNKEFTRNLGQID